MCDVTCDAFKGIEGMSFVLLFLAMRFSTVTDMISNYFHFVNAKQLNENNLLVIYVSVCSTGCVGSALRQTLSVLLH